MKAVSLFLTAAVLLSGSFSFASNASLFFKSAGRLSYEKVNEEAWPDYQGQFDGKNLADVLGAVVFDEELANCPMNHCTQTTLLRNMMFRDEESHFEPMSVGQRIVTGIVLNRSLTVYTQERVTTLSGSCSIKYLNAVIIQFEERSTPGHASVIAPNSVKVEVRKFGTGHAVKCN